ncbi:MAG: SH3 domain-containing protein, partial [Anaerolineae bacterium]|nr:SH3 domain-containing protein [Anaerolineae bacterium]
VIVLLLVLPLVYTSAPDIAQSADTNSCPDIVARAWESLDDACADGARNTACYGHILLDATPQPFVTDWQFETVGDLANLAEIQSLQLSSMDLTEGLWGVALITLQANIPAALPDQNVSLLMFGDVQIDNASPLLPQVDVYANAAGGANANVRARPEADAAVIGVIPRGSFAPANGRLADNSWVRVQLPDADQAGWVWVPIIRTAPEDDLNTLDIVAPTQPFYGPMQAFYLTAAVDDAACPEAPNSGIFGPDAGRRGRSDAADQRSRYQHRFDRVLPVEPRRSVED